MRFHVALSIVSCAFALPAAHAAGRGPIRPRSCSSPSTTRGSPGSTTCN